VPVGGVLAFLSITGWSWPRHQERRPPWRGGEEP
jgi:hypothetical protein